MEKTTTVTPPSHAAAASRGADDRGVAAKKMFNSSALGMGWQLAVAVLIPIYGGYLLDNKFDSSPLCTLIGLVLSTALSVVIIRRAVKNLNEAMNLSLNQGNEEIKH